MPDIDEKSYDYSLRYHLGSLADYKAEPGGAFSERIQSTEGFPLRPRRRLGVPDALW